MGKWVTAVRNGGDVTELIPVNVPPRLEYAEMLASRLNFIKESLLTSLGEESNGSSGA